MAAGDVAVGGSKTSLPFFVKFQVLVALFATALTVGLALYLPTLVSRKAQLEKDINDLTAQRDSLKKEKEQLAKQRDAYHNIVNSAAAALPPEQAQQVLDESLKSNPDAAKLLPRIFVHIRSAGQKPKASELAKSLRAQGYIVPGVQILVNEGPEDNQVRYFHDSDNEKKEAADIAAALASAGVAKPDVKYVSNYPNIRARQYEIWFAPNAL